MSDSEEENFCYFGKPLEPYDEDAFPKKKPISVEEQIATDAQGRRRFHGAFTGGFSAGFYNTVGSLEGWTPSDFKSTRQDKAQNKAQRPEDFMDDEDIGEFGIAPQTVRATKDYATSKKRRKQVFSDGPIPGEPVLHSLLVSGNETIGYLLLKNIGLKGRDVEPEPETARERIYGCEMPKTYEISRDNVNQYEIADIYREFLQKPKDNTFGLGYTGLDKTHLNLFQSAKLVLRGSDNKKVSISGQAFGVGAFEDDDDDIYVKDDMSRYDFELTSEKSSKKDSSSQSNRVFDDFVSSKNLLEKKEVFLPPTIPHSFTGKHKLKRSRFEPLPEESQAPERRDMSADIRARYLGEEPPEQKETKEDLPEPEAKQSFDLFNLSSSSGLVFDRFVSASKPEDPSNILEVVQPSEHGTEEMRAAAKMKMFGPLTRITTDWQPSSVLCKRFNVPEPQSTELTGKNRKRTKNLIFEYEKFADLSSMDFKPGLSSKEPESEPQKTEQNVEEQVTNIEEEPEEVAKLDVTDKIDVDKNTDLFKAIFLSSSESEGEEENQSDDKKAAMKSSVLSETLLPIKPIKEGILSNMDFSIFSGPADVTVNTEIDDQSEDLSYGPALPSRPNPGSSGAVSSKSLIKSSDNEEEWVEKCEKEKKGKSHKKKHRHKKSSHKKKRKHDRD